ncbi:hypothetical protein CLR69_21265 [Pectobacterium zantedeschiae]|uniref:Uncharacterized protein n=1 Tax=Pectobacterium zantedeschiae TaxID=2034769 RepID=A0A9X8P3D2_9GAMM|nr:hypothetical protein CLR69_21265 [Pectobacterium zantedeschiae]
MYQPGKAKADIRRYIRAHPQQFTHLTSYPSLLIIFQVACALATHKYSARRGPSPSGPTLYVVQNANVLS